VKNGTGYRSLASLFYVLDPVPLDEMRTTLDLTQRVLRFFIAMCP